MAQPTLATVFLLPRFLSKKKSRNSDSQLYILCPQLASCYNLQSLVDLHPISMCTIFTVRKRCLGQDNVFTPVCHPVGGGRLCIMSLPVWLLGPVFILCPEGKGSLPKGSPVRLRTGGAHPTGMFSCIKQFSFRSNSMKQILINQSGRMRNTFSSLLFVHNESAFKSTKILNGMLICKI